MVESYCHILLILQQDPTKNENEAKAKIDRALSSEGLSDSNTVQDYVFSRLFLRFTIFLIFSPYYIAACFLNDSFFRTDLVNAGRTYKPLGLERRDLAGQLPPDVQENTSYR